MIINNIIIIIIPPLVRHIQTQITRTHPFSQLSVSAYKWKIVPWILIDQLLGCIEGICIKFVNINAISCSSVAQRYIKFSIIHFGKSFLATFPSLEEIISVFFAFFLLLFFVVRVSHFL